MILKFNDKDINFNKVVGGFGWPELNPGFFCVVGEYSTLTSMGRDPQYYVLAEAQDDDIEKLIEDIIRLRIDYQVQGVYGRTSKHGSQKLPAMKFLGAWNEQTGASGGQTCRIRKAPYTDDGGSILYHMNLIKSLSKPDQRALFLFEESRLKGYLREVPEDPKLLKDTNYPAVAALGYALSVLDRQKIEDLNPIGPVASYKPLDPYIGV